MAEQPKIPAPATPLRQHLFAAFAGIFISLGLLKFGTPVVLDHKVIPPADVWEVIYHTWPVDWAYIALALFAFSAIPLARWETPQPKWPFVLLLTWLVWQFLSAGQTISPSLSASSLKHFVGATICFGIGYFALANVKDLRMLLIFLLMGFILVLRVGLEQHFGGLERTRFYFYTYILPNLPEPPLDYLQKISTNRIFSTLFYPNSFAGAILLFLPITAFGGWRIAQRFGRLPQIVLTGIITLTAVGCLYWSGSKSGWLILLVLGLILLIHSPLNKTVKIGLVSAVLIAGAGAFTLKYSGFFKKGATSVVARFDYWTAAVRIFKEEPLLGTGPGTFSIAYAKIKKPESEMARLTHNDYLEQACDSGIVGFLCFFGFIIGSLLHLYRYRIPKNIDFPFLLWLGVTGIAAQSLSEFNFYIPGLAWPVFLFLGWLWATTKPFDKQKPAK